MGKAGRGWHRNMGNNGVKNHYQALDLLLEKVYRGGGYDFRDYKRGTVTRRLQRRLYATGTATYEEYTRFLESHPDEYQSLADDLTIKVSGFFRSRHTFQQVARMVLPRLVAHKIKRGECRLSLWSAACARGEEPYSMAIQVADFLGSQLAGFEVSIYASDINHQALAEAQSALYSPKELEGLPPPLLAKHFSRNGEGYVVNSNIRRMVSFFHFDLVSTPTPPFTTLDCVFCCNILIYLQRQLQERVLSMVYDSLTTPGYLVLGEVETPPDSLRPRLECLNTKAKIYKKA
jgi:chemotaxis methyl-accepting protein methylase